MEMNNNEAIALLERAADRADAMLEMAELAASDARAIARLLKEQKPIVFCGDCKYWNAGTCLNDKVSRQIEDCGCYPDFVTNSNWFCAEGERKGDIVK